MARSVPQPSLDSFDLTTILSALADPTRRELLRHVYRESEPVECAVIARNVDVSSATVSHHWRILREAGLTHTAVHGRSRFITVRRDDMERMFPGLLDAVLNEESATRISE